MSRTLLVLGFGLATSLLCPTSTARGEDSAAAVQSLRSLFDAGWQKTYSAREEAKKYYIKSQKALSGDLRVERAWLLVLLRQSRYPEALKQVDEILQSDKKDRMAWEIKAWLTAITKEYDASMACMQRAAELMPAVESSGDEELSYREAAAFLGRLCGFFESAVKDSVDDATLAACRQRILARLTTSRQEFFDQARRGVVRDFVGAAEETAATTEANEAEAAKQKQRTIEDLKRKADENQSQIAEAQANEEKARETLEYELSKISSAESNLQSRGQRVEADYAAARAAFLSCDARVTDCALHADQETDPNLRNYWLNELARWRIERGQRANAMNVLDRQVAALRGEALGLQRQRAEAEGRYQREAAKIDSASRAYDKTRAQLGRAQNQTVTGVNATVRDQKRKAVALTSHVPLPILLDAERDKILESLQGK